MSTASANPSISPNADPLRPTRVQNTFCGLQPLWTRADRFYKFHITPEAIYAAWLGGQYHDKTSTRLQLSPFYLVLVGFVFAEPFAVCLRPMSQLAKETEHECPLSTVR